VIRPDRRLASPRTLNPPTKSPCRQHLPPWPPPISPAVPPLRAAATPVAALPAQAGSVTPPSPEAIAKAEGFAHKNIVAAAQIRHDRGATPQNKAYLRHVALPADPAGIDALVRGASNVLTLLDEVGGEDLDEVA
jgi:hypothetical protein